MNSNDGKHKIIFGQFMDLVLVAQITQYYEAEVARWSDLLKLNHLQPKFIRPRHSILSMPRSLKCNAPQSSDGLSLRPGLGLAQAWTGLGPGTSSGSGQAQVRLRSGLARAQVRLSSGSGRAQYLEGLIELKFCRLDLSIGMGQALGHRLGLGLSS